MVQSDYNWCCGPDIKENNHRIRGVKGSKVLRTRKIAIRINGRSTLIWKYFCSQTCWNDFIYKHWEEFIALHPKDRGT